MKSIQPTINYNSSTFTLRGINQQDLINAYIRGEHRKISIENIKNRKPPVFSEPPKQIKADLTGDPNCKSYLLNSNSTKQIIHTTNQDLYELVYNNNRISEIKFECFYCRVEKETIPVGFPMIINIYIDKYVIHIDEPYYCSLECVNSALSDSKEDTSIIEENLNFLNSLMYPGRELKKAKNWKLHEKNHGPLSEQEYRYSESKFIQLSSVILLPLKRQYIEYK